MLLLKHHYSWVEYIVKKLNINEVLPASTSDGFFKYLCTKFMSIYELHGYFTSEEDLTLNDYTATRVMFAHTPAGGAVRGILHPLQLALVDRYQCYDFGEERNFQ